MSITSTIKTTEHAARGRTADDAVHNGEVEGFTVSAAFELAVRPVPVTGDLRQLTAIHGHLFHDVYDWAGELRTVDMRKGTDTAAEFFMPVSRLRTGAGFVFQELADDRHLRGLDKGQFVSRLAHHYDQVNGGARHLSIQELCA